MLCCRLTEGFEINYRIVGTRAISMYLLTGIDVLVTVPDYIEIQGRAVPASKVDFLTGPKRELL